LIINVLPAEQKRTVVTPLLKNQDWTPRRTAGTRNQELDPSWHSCQSW